MGQIFHGKIQVAEGEVEVGERLVVDWEDGDLRHRKVGDVRNAAKSETTFLRALLLKSRKLVWPN